MGLSKPAKKNHAVTMSSETLIKKRMGFFLKKRFMDSMPWLFIALLSPYYHR
jgi:hypothetical protein